MKICPLCEQGLINEVMIKSTNERIYLCEECEALWLNKQINSTEVLNFDDYMKKRNMKPVWDELEIVKQL
jgi:Zn-finger nucleic acid-binding protein